MKQQEQCPVCGRIFDLMSDADYGLLWAQYGGCKCGYAFEYLEGNYRWFYGPFEVRSDGPRDRLLRLMWQVWTFDGCLTQAVQP